MSEFVDYSLADDILNIPYIDSDNMDEYLKNLADRARKLEIKRDDIKRALNMHYGIPKVEFDPEKHKEWLYDIFGVKPMQVHMDLMEEVRNHRPWGYDDKFEHNAVVKLVEQNQIITEVKEDTDNFIFETIKPWCEERIERKISKVDLEQALLMYYSLDSEDIPWRVYCNQKPVNNGEEQCPICEYSIEDCQCRFGGDWHPDRSRRREIVKDHLEMLSPQQIDHLIQLEKHWQISYGNSEDATEFEKFKDFMVKNNEAL